MSDTAGPRMRVRLPDGQEITVLLRGRRRELDGTWWYTVEVPLWTKTERRGQYSGEPGPVQFDAPAKQCSPIDGEDYSQVPTTRVTSELEYLAERRQLTAGTQLVVHRRGCRAPTGPITPLHERQARAALDDGAQGCGACRPWE